jgi:hypothetical protein
MAFTIEQRFVTLRSKEGKGQIFKRPPVLTQNSTVVGMITLLSTVGSLLSFRIRSRGIVTAPDSGYRSPPEIVQQAIWLYLRFTLSLRDVETSWQNAALQSCPCRMPYRHGSGLADRVVSVSVGWSRF